MYFSLIELWGEGEATSISFSAEEMGLGYPRTEPGWPVYECLVGSEGWGGQAREGHDVLRHPQAGVGLQAALRSPLEHCGREVTLLEGGEEEAAQEILAASSPLLEPTAAATRHRQ